MYPLSDRERSYAESKFIHDAFRIAGRKKSRATYFFVVEENAAPLTIGHLHSAGSFVACNAERIRDGTDGGCRHFYVASRIRTARTLLCAKGYS